MNQSEVRTVEGRNPWVRLLVLAGLLVGVIVYFWGPNMLLGLKKSSGGKSEPFQIPAELVYEAPAGVPAKDNGFLLLIEACQMVPNWSKDFDFITAWGNALTRSWTPNEDVEQFMQLVDHARKKLREALSKPAWICPKIEIGAEPPLPAAKFRMLAHAEAIDANRMLAEGDVDRAAMRALLLIELGRRLQASHGTMLEFASGIATEGLGAAALMMVLESPMIQDERLVEIARLLLDNTAAVESEVRTLQIMFGIMLKETERAAADNETNNIPSVFLDRDATSRAIAEHYLAELQNIKKPYAERDRQKQVRLEATKAEVERLRDDVQHYRKTRRATWRLLFAQNPYGRWAEYAYVPVSEKLELLRREHLFMTNGAATVAALVMYRRKHGELPETLDKLVADGLLTALPQDPFNLKPLGYSREKERLWSVAIDGVDQDGEFSVASEEAFASGVGDFVIAIPKASVPEPK